MHLCCAKCTSVLDNRKVDDVEVDLCPSCGGLWLDHGEIERLERAGKAEVDELRKLLAKEGPPPEPSDTKDACPSCTTRMKEVTLGPIHIDVCPSCKGVFLDRGELDQALTTVRDARASMSTLLRTVAAEAKAK